MCYCFRGCCFAFVRTLVGWEVGGTWTPETDAYSRMLFDRTSFAELVPPGHVTTLAAPVGTPPTVGPRTDGMPFSPHSIFDRISLLQLIACRLVTPPAAGNAFDSGKVGVPDTGTETKVLRDIEVVTGATPVPWDGRNTPAPLVDNSVATTVTFTYNTTDTPLIGPCILFEVVVAPPAMTTRAVIPGGFRTSYLTKMLPDRWPVFGSMVGPPTVSGTMRAAPPVAGTTAVPRKPFGPATAVAARTEVDIVDIVPRAKLMPAVTVTLTTAMMGEGRVPTAGAVTAVMYVESPYVASG